MTREELKEHCKKQIEMCEMWAIAKGEEPSGNVYEEHKLILELLEQEPCKDAISRQDALDALHMCLSTNSYDDDVTGDSYICYEEAEYEIEKLQSVQPKPIDCEDAISREDALMCMTGEFSPAVIYKPEVIISKRIQRIKALPSVTPRSLNPEADREESKAYCAECDHIEMCSWYPHDGCEWLKTDRYNAAKREIALSGEYERAYERGKADAHPDINDGKLSEIPTGLESEGKE